MAVGRDRPIADAAERRTGPGSFGDPGRGNLAVGASGTAASRCRTCRRCAPTARHYAGIVVADPVNERDRANRYSTVVHGVRLCDESPAADYPEDAAGAGYDRVIEAGIACP